MKTKLVLALFILGNVAAFGQKLYPVQGPFASQTPTPVFSGQIRHPIFSIGGPPKLLKSFTLANGEVLLGKCIQIKATTINPKTPGTPEGYPPQPNLAFAWDTIYGQGYFAARVLGVEIWQGIFKGNSGMLLQVEILDSQHGAAADNKGNIYKVVW